ncbi:MAG: helix-turn-helix transcriptional regulator, partial [Prosthecobacter sp.]|nr:helix-turn-helix transcriptional regulator [Prosthecobacter sp.]
NRMDSWQVSKSIFTTEYSVFRDLLRELRTEKGLTQVQLSETLGMPQSFVSKYETGERRLDVIEVREVCQSLGTTLAAFAKKLEARLPESKKGGVA